MIPKHARNEQTKRETGAEKIAKLQEHLKTAEKLHADLSQALHAEGDQRTIQETLRKISGIEQDILRMRNELRKLGVTGEEITEKEWRYIESVIDVGISEIGTYLVVAANEAAHAFAQLPTDTTIDTRGKTNPKEALTIGNQLKIIESYLRELPEDSALWQEHITKLFTTIDQTPNTLEESQKNGDDEESWNSAIHIHPNIKQFFYFILHNARDRILEKHYSDEELEKRRQHLPEHTRELFKEILDIEIDIIKKQTESVTPELLQKNRPLLAKNILFEIAKSIDVYRDAHFVEAQKHETPLTLGFYEILTQTKEYTKDGIYTDKEGNTIPLTIENTEPNPEESEYVKTNISVHLGEPHNLSVEIKVPAKEHMLHKGGSARILAKLAFQAPVSTILAEFPLNDVDIIVGHTAEEALDGTLTKKEEAAREVLGADATGVDRQEITSSVESFLSDILSTRDVDMNEVLIGSSGIIYSEPAKQAIQTGTVSGGEHPQELFGNQTFRITVDKKTIKLYRPQGLYRLCKIVAEGKALSFTMPEMNKSINLGPYILVLARRFAKKPHGRALLDNLYYIAKQSGSIPDTDKTIYDTIHRLLEEYPDFDLSQKDLDEEGESKWLIGKSGKYIKRMMSRDLPAELVGGFEHSSDTTPATISLIDKENERPITDEEFKKLQEICGN